jgi:hypothetical protein
MMPGAHTVQLAIKYATRLRLLQLAQRLSDVASRKAEEELAGLDDEMEEEEVQPVRRRYGLLHVHCHVTELQNYFSSVKQTGWSAAICPCYEGTENSWV